MNRSTLLQVALAVLALLAALFTWKRPAEAMLGEVELFPIAKSDLEAVRYESGPRRLSLDRAKDGLYLTYGSDELLAADGGVVAKAAPPRTVRANDAAEKLFERLAPLRANRALGVLPEKTLEEVGLAKPTRKLTLVAAGKSYSLPLGTPDQGLGAPYAKLENGQVYLLDARLASDLEAGASRLTDRRVHTFSLDEVTGLTVEAGGKRRGFAANRGELTVPGKPEPAELERNWHDKVWRSLVADVLGKGMSPEGGEPKVEVRIDYEGRDGPLGFIELARSPDRQTWARTEHTVSWVKLHAGAEGLFDEAGKIVAGP